MDEQYYSFIVRIPKPTMRWFRFSLVSSLILITAICLLLGLWPRHGNRKLQAIQLQRLPAESVADVIKQFLVNGPDASNSKTAISKPSVEVDIDTNTIRFSANEAELKTIEELLLKLGKAPKSPASQGENPPKSKSRDISHQQAYARS